MGIIKALKLGFDYFKYDDDGNIQETQRAVDQVSVDIQEGEFVAVLGHNGSGKSTFAKHINALLLPTEGTIWIDNMDTMMLRLKVSNVPITGMNVSLKC